MTRGKGGRRLVSCMARASQPKDRVELLIGELCLVAGLSALGRRGCGGEATRTEGFERCCDFLLRERVTGGGTGAEVRPHVFHGSWSGSGRFGCHCEGSWVVTGSGTDERNGCGRAGLRIRCWRRSGVIKRARPPKACRPVTGSCNRASIASATERGTLTRHSTGGSG